MVGYVEEKNLCGADQQRRFRARRLFRRPAFEEKTQHIAERSEPPDHCGCKRTDKSAIALRKLGEPAMRGGALEKLVERPMPPQHAFNDVSGDSAGGEPRRLAMGCGSRLPARSFHLG